MPLVVVLVGVAFRLRPNRPGVGEQLRALADIPTNTASNDSSGFEKGEREPANARERRWIGDPV